MTQMEEIEAMLKRLDTLAGRVDAIERAEDHRRREARFAEIVNAAAAEWRCRLVAENGQVKIVAVD